MVTTLPRMYPYAFSEVAAIYPITPPRGPMADFVDQWSANGLKEHLRHPA